MKKIMALILSLALILALGGCSIELYKLPDGDFCTLAIDGSTVELDDAEKEYILKLLNEGDWYGETAKCPADYNFKTKAQSIGYCAEDGVFNDFTFRRSLSVSDEEMNKINEILGYLPPEQNIPEPTPPEGGCKMGNHTWDDGVLIPRPEGQDEMMYRCTLCNAAKVEILTEDKSSYSFEEIYNISKHIDLDKITEVRIDRSNTTAIRHMFHYVDIITSPERIFEVVQYINSTSFTPGGEVLEGGGAYSITLISDNGTFEFNLMPENATYVDGNLYTSSLDFPFLGKYDDFYTYIKPYGEVQLSIYGEVKTLTDFDITKIHFADIDYEHVGPIFRKDVELIIDGHVFKILEPNVIYSESLGCFFVKGKNNFAELIPEGVSSSQVSFVTEDGKYLGIVIVSNHVVYTMEEIGEMLYSLCGGTLTEVKNSDGVSFDEWVFTSGETLTVSYTPRC